MAHNQHTPAPWVFDPDDFTEVFSPDSGALICKVLEADDFPCLEEGTHGDVQDECLANARLIAAAPEMLSALDHIGGLSSALRQGGPDPMDLQGLSDALSEAVDLANSIVSKATQP